MGFRLRPTVITFTSGVAPQALDLDVGISFNAGTDYWRIKWKGKLHETRAGTYGFFGNKAVSNGSATGFAMYFPSGGGNGQIQLSRGGSQVILMPAIILRDSSTDYVYEIEHLSDGTLIYRRDDVEVAARGAYTASNAFTTSTQVLNSLYRRSVGPTAGVADLELEYFEAQFGAGPTRRWSGKDIVSPADRLVCEGGDGSDDFIQTSTWPTGNEEWIFYDTGTGTPVKSGTFSASAVAGASVSGTKIAVASFTAAANALASVAGSKLGVATFQAAVNVYFGLGTTLKIAKGSFSAQVIASAYVPSGNDLIITGTFSASAVASVSMTGSKVGFSGFAASAVANSSVSGTKRAAGTFHAPARATGTGNGLKVAHGSFAAVSHVQANIFGYNASIQMPVAEWVIFTTSQPAIAVLTNSEPSATLFTLSQQVYSIHTNS
jgi:hypothetical protein